MANAFVLYANYKHYHWQTYGPLFRDLHKLFDKLANDVLSTIDELAERVSESYVGLGVFRCDRERFAKKLRCALQFVPPRIDSHVDVTGAQLLHGSLYRRRGQLLMRPPALYQRSSRRR